MSVGPFYTLILQPPSICFLPTGLPSAKLTELPNKDPNDTLPIALDCTAYLATNGFTLTNGTSLLAEPTIRVPVWNFIVTNNAFTGVWFQIKGGVSGIMSKISVRLAIADSFGALIDTLVFTMTCPVVSRSSIELLPVLPPMLSDSFGQVLTDSFGRGLSAYGNVANASTPLTDSNGLMLADSFGNVLTT